MKKIICLSFLLSLLIPLHLAFANDTDLYILTQVLQQVPPDALIILDLSGSMNYTAGEDTLYVDQSSHCTSHTYDSSFSGPYYSLSGTGHTYQCTGIPQTNGPIYGDSSCSDTTGFYRSSGTGHTTNCSKVEIAKRAIFTFLDYSTPPNLPTKTTYGDQTINVNDDNALSMLMGYMRFYNCSNPESTINYNSDCNTLLYPFGTAYSKIYCNNSTSCIQSSSGSNSVSSEQASGGTPLAAALQEALKYFNDSKNGDTAAACRQKFAILITDGADTYACSGNGQETQTTQYKRRRETVAQARALANAGYYVFVVGFGASMPYYQQNTLNWTAYYGNTKRPGQTQSQSGSYVIPPAQIYPSGIPNNGTNNTQQCATSQTATAADGHYYATTYDPGEQGISGYAFIAQNATDLQTAIQDIRQFIIQIIAQSTSYVAPVVPISQYQHTSSESSMYLGMFEPTTNTFWKGNIKRYGISTTNTQTLHVGDIIDVNNQLVMTSQNGIKDSAQSYWSLTADGGDVEKGGIGAILLSGNPDGRNIYTYLGNTTDLTNQSNGFALSNTTYLTNAKLSVTSSTDRTNVINFVHGWDGWNWYGSGTNVKRDWILGAFIHSRPLVIHYSNKDVIYAGANDGMLHAFDNTNANELWAFIPPDLLPNLKNFNTQPGLQIFVDGTPKAYVTYDSNNNVTKAILIFGERRGGNNYIALDVTNYNNPTFLWAVNPSTAGYSELGQTWSTPILGKIKNGTGTKWVAFIGGGYDTNQDNTAPASDAHGRAVYIVDITNGSQVWKYSFSNNSNMKYSIPSDITPIDVNGDGLIERLYVGDLGGQIWRFDIGDMTNTASWTGKLIFQGNGKIFYPPDVTFENDRGSGTYDMLFFGTGDREKPNDSSVVNTLYAIKDYDNDVNPPTPLPLGESNLQDVTSDVLQDLNQSATAKANMLNYLKTKSGWYIRLNQSPGEGQYPGEKCDASAVVLGGTIYFTTFTPVPPAGPCSLNTGQGNIYILQYQTGSAAFNLDQIGGTQATQLRPTDRSTGVGSGIPSGIIITVINDIVTAYGGVAGGVFSPKLTITRSIVPLDWRIVF